VLSFSIALVSPCKQTGKPVGCNRTRRVATGSGHEVGQAEP
jgi:hypothetical protein